MKKFKLLVIFYLIYPTVSKATEVALSNNLSSSDSFNPPSNISVEETAITIEKLLPLPENSLLSKSNSLICFKTKYFSYIASFLAGVSVSQGIDFSISKAYEIFQSTNGYTGPSIIDRIFFSLMLGTIFIAIYASSKKKKNKDN